MDIFVKFWFVSKGKLCRYLHGITWFDSYDESLGSGWYFSIEKKLIREQFLCVKSDLMRLSSKAAAIRQRFAISRWNHIRINPPERYETKLRKNENVISLLKDNMNVKSTALTSSSEKNNTSYVCETFICDKIFLAWNEKKAKEKSRVEGFLRGRVGSAFMWMLKRKLLRRSQQKLWKK